MTDERLYVPGLSDDEQATLNRLSKKLKDRSGNNQMRASFYDCKTVSERISNSLPGYLFQLRSVLGWSAKAVDMLARRCNPEGFVWPDGDILDLGYAEFAESNQLLAQLKAGRVSSLIHGVSFLVNTRGQASENEPASLFHVRDALNATGDWNNRARRLDSLLTITDRDEKDEPVGFVLYLDNLTITGQKSDGVWSVERSTHSWGVPAEPLVYRPRVGRELGSSRISPPIMSIQRRALREVLRMEGHMDVYSIPQMILLGASEDIFKNADGTLKTSWQIALGRVFGIPDDPDRDDNLARADIKQFQAASPEPHIAMFKQLAMEFSGEASIPLTSLGVSDQSNPTSADSYIASREDLIAEAEGATDDWRPAERRAVVRGLAIQNGIDVPDEWASIDIQNRSPIYLSRAAQADAGSKQLAVMPWLAETEVGLELLGMTPQQIRRAMSERRRAEGRRTIEALANMAPLDEVPSGDSEPSQPVPAG